MAAAVETLETSRHVPSYMKVSCIVSGYGRYTSYSPYDESKLSRLNTSSMLSLYSTPRRKISYHDNNSDIKSPSLSSTDINHPPREYRGHKCLTNEFPSSNHSELKVTNYFLSMMDDERKRLQDQCDKAECDISSGIIPEEACGKLRAAIGKTQLLLTKKFKQFGELCENHSNPTPGEPLTKKEDLQGFWDMVHIQIDDVDYLFGELELMRRNNWAEIPHLHLLVGGSSNSSPRSLSLSSRSTTPSHTPGSRRRVLVNSSSSKSLTDLTLKPKQPNKRHDDARRKLLAEKRAAMKLAQSNKSDVQIFISNNDSGISL